MKLFKGSKRNKAEDLMRNLEKIAKIAVLRIEKEDTQSIIDDLTWIEDNFIKLIKLQDTNIEKFKLLIDPENRYKKVAFEAIDWSKVDFSKVTVVNRYQKVNEEDIRYQKNYHGNPPPDKTDLIGKYIDVIFTIWNKSSEKKNFPIQKTAAFVIANWIGILDKQNSDTIDFREMIKYFLQSITSLNRDILEAKGEDLQPLFRFLSFNVYLNQIFRDDVNSENSAVYFQFLFENIYMALRANRPIVPKEFIERCISSNYYPTTEFTKYSELQSLLNDNLAIKIDTYEKRGPLLKRIPSLAFYEIRYLRTEEEYQDWQKEFDTYLTGLNDIVEFTAEIKEKIVEVKQLGLKLLNFNRLQITVLKVLVYAIFKGNKDIVNEGFEFNQPGDSNAIWGNKEILPDSLAEILNFMTSSYAIESDLLRYWEGHHGIEPYIDCLFLKLVYEYNPQQKYHLEDPKAITTEFCKSRLKNNSSSVTALQTEAKELRQRLENIEVNKTSYLDDYFKNEKKRIRAKELLSTIISTCETVLTTIQTGSEIKAETKQRFFRESINQYKKINYIHQLFKLFEKKAVPSIESRPVNPGVNELFDRIAFIDNWHVPYLGIIESTGIRIAELENSFGLGVIKRLATIQQQEKITESQVADVIRSAQFANKIVIGSNLYFESVLRAEQDFISVWSQGEKNIIPDFYVGKLGSAQIFNLYDKIFSNKILMILSSDDLIGVSETVASDAAGFTQLDGFSCKFVDFALEQQSRDDFLAAPPDWLLAQMPQEDERLKYIKSQVWIQILKKIKFDVSNQKRALFYYVS